MSTKSGAWQDDIPPIVPLIPPGSRKHIDVQALALQHQVEPIRDPNDLRGDFWPEDESLDEFLNELRASRRDSM
jgi:hypothetical protein